jgi:hypothetical protein
MTKVLITSPPDRDTVVAEVYFGDAQFAELRVEGSSIVCEVYASRSGRPWRVGLRELREALSQAEKRLTGDIEQERNDETKAD